MFAGDASDNKKAPDLHQAGLGSDDADVNF
jgi:hypothetical protein